jgi:hypothetical protein
MLMCADLSDAEDIPDEEHQLMVNQAGSVQGRENWEGGEEEEEEKQDAEKEREGLDKYGEDSCDDKNGEIDERGEGLGLDIHRGTVEAKDGNTRGAGAPYIEIEEPLERVGAQVILAPSTGLHFERASEACAPTAQLFLRNNTEMRVAFKVCHSQPNVLN